CIVLYAAAIVDCLHGSTGLSDIVVFYCFFWLFFFFFQAEDGIRDSSVTGVQTCALPISPRSVGVVWGLAPYDTKRLIEAAQQKAVRATLSMLEREATWARRGRNGAFLEKVALTSATFRHGESRPAQQDRKSVV